jgi:hypothetical protein
MPDKQVGISVFFPYHCSQIWPPRGGAAESPFSQMEMAQLSKPWTLSDSYPQQSWMPCLLFAFVLQGLAGLGLGIHFAGPHGAQRKKFFGLE